MAGLANVLTRPPGKRYVPSGQLRLWLDASVLGLADGAAIGPWTDLTTRVTVDGPVASQRPLFDNTPGQNGLGYAAFDGTNDTLTVADPDLLDFGLDSFVVFFVGSTGAPATAGQYLVRKKSGTTSATAGWSLRVNASNSFVAILADGTTQASVTDPTANDGAWHVWMFVVDRRSGADVLEIWKDGTVVGASATSVTGSTSNAEPLWVGDWASPGFAQQIGEVRVYSGLLQDNARGEEIAAELKAKWGVVSLQTSSAVSRSSGRATAPSLVTTTSSAASRTDGRAIASGFSIIASSAVSRSSSRALAPTLVLVAGVAGSRSSSRSTAPTLVQVLGSAASRTDGRAIVASLVQTASSATSRSSGRALASGGLILAGSTTSRSSGRATSPTVVLVAGVAASRTSSRALAPSLVLVRGEAATRSSSRATAPSLVLVAGVSASRSSSRATLASSVLTTSSAVLRSSGRAYASGDTAAANVVTSSGSSRTSSRSTAPSLVVVAGAAGSRSSSRATATAVVQTSSAAASRSSGRAVVAASLVVGSSATSRTSSRETTIASVLTLVASSATSRTSGRALVSLSPPVNLLDVGHVAIVGDVGSSTRPAEVGASGVTGDIG